MDNTLYELVNPHFTFKLADKEYKVRKANLEKAILYQKKAKELADSKEPAVELKLVAYCITIVLQDIDPNITEDFVLANVPADIDVIECLTILGFMSPQRMTLAKRVQEVLEKQKQISESSSQPSPTEQGGLQGK